MAATPVELNRFLANFARALRDKLPPGLRVQLQVAADLPAVPGDEIQLRQALEILCGNAQEAMKEGGEIMLAGATRKFDLQSTFNTPGARPGEFAVVTVADTGSGMSPEVLDKAFEPFYTTKDVGQGVGLGLATALGIVKGHGGFMNVETAPGKGTQFQIFLPVKP